MNIAATPPTPERAAKSLAYGYDRGNVGYIDNHVVCETTTSGNVVTIAITPADDDGEQREKTYFEAHVFLDEAATPVATNPVELPAGDAQRLANMDAGGTHLGWTVAVNEYIEKQRWESIHRLVIRNEAGQHYSDTYRRGLTESQDTGPWEYEDVATFTPVERRTRVVQSHEWVTPAPASL